MSGATHDELILDQFTRQARPFSSAAMITDAAALRMIVEAAGCRPNDRLLDVACGPGLVVCAFAPHVASAIGIDLTPAMLERAGELAAEQGVTNAAWDIGDVYALPYADARFTLVVTRYSFHHLLDPLAALREMVRVCAPGGRIVVVDAYASEDPAKAAAFNRLEKLRDPSHARSLPLREIESLFRAAGLAPPRVAYYQLRTELRQLMARCFPDPGDEARIAAVFRAAAADDSLGIPVRLDGDDVHIAYPVAILVAERQPAL